MYIRTANRGWQPLTVNLTNHIEAAPPRYRGPLPSLDCLAFIRAGEMAHNEWLVRRAQLHEPKDNGLFAGGQPKD